MDESTTGLHPIDVENFLMLLNHMVDSGNTVIVVEHNQQIIRASDWIIDLGPAGGQIQVISMPSTQAMLRNGNFSSKVINYKS